jgi:hypothetical protein
MVNVTESAMGELQRIVRTSSIEAGKYLRLATPPEWIGEGDFGIVIDGNRDGDVVIDFEGQPILLIAGHLSERLSNSVFDFKQTPQGIGFSLDVY